jgi:RNA polymerase sigma factor (sigma-70 family)
MQGPGKTGGMDERLPVAPRADATTDAELVSAMRRGEPGAFTRFVERHHRILLDYARRAGLAEDECDDFVGELLEDVALHFITRAAALPENTRLYLLSSFRHKLLNSKRARMRRSRVVREAASDAYADCDFADATDAAAGCSESSLRASHGPAWERAPMPPALERLAARLSDGLTADERQLLVAVAENVPQREIAEWLGVSYAVARKRLERLRARLTEVAMRYTNTLPPDDARELQRFFRRCRTRIGASVRSQGSDDPLAREA